MAAVRVLGRSVFVVALVVALCCGGAQAGPVPLNFDGGNGTSQVDQYPGKSGSGWDTAWAAHKYDPGGSGAIAGTVVSTNPLSGGNYLSASITDCRGMFGRRYSSTSGSVDAAEPHAIQFKYRLDSMSAGFSAGGRPVLMLDNASATSSSGSSNTWSVQVAKSTGSWSAGGGSTGVPLSVGTVYDVVVMLRPASNKYDLYVSGGGNSGVQLDSDFRRKDGDVGRYVHFGDDTNGATGGISGNSVEFSLDGVKVLPAAKVWNNTDPNPLHPGSWTYNDGNINWCGAAPPTSTDDAVIDNGYEAAIRSSGVAEVKTLYLGATPGGYGGINWIRSSPIDMHVYENLIVGEEGTGVVRMTDYATGRTLTIDNHLYIGRRTGSTGTVTQDRGTMDVADNLLMGYSASSTGEYNLQGGQLTVRNKVGLKTQSQIGISGSATFNHTGGTFSITGNDLFLGQNNSGVGTYNLSGAGSILDLRDDFTIGRSGTGIFKHNDGQVTVRDTFVLGVNATGTGQYTLTDGIFLAQNASNPYAPTIGANGTGVFTQEDGSATFQSTQGQSLILGNGGTGDGSYIISGGSLDVQIPMIVGNAGTGRFHIIGDDATINVDGYTQGAGGTLELDINGISAINVDGTVTLAGALDVQFDETPWAGQEFLIIDKDGTEAVIGTFDDLEEGAAFMAPGFDFNVVISYEGGTGNDVVLTATPEPATLTLLGLGGLAMLIRRRRTR